jgi:protein TonB
VRLRLPRVHLTALDNAIGGAVLLNPGVASSAPDFARLASPPGDFERGRLVEAARDVRSPVRPAGSAYSVADVEEPPVALVGNPRPAYPPALARARVDGRVVVQFQIDSTGAVDVHSLRVLESTHALFTDAVRAVVPLLRFLPAHIGHRAVRVFVQQPFAFEMAAGS